MINNLLNNNYNFLGSLNALKGAKLIKGTTTIVTAGDINSVYTCPANKKALVFRVASTAIGSSLNAYINISSVNYEISRYSFSNPILPFFVDSGQTFAISVGSGSNSICWCNIIEFDSSVPISINYLTTFINGNNTLYTCPSNTIAVPLSYCTFASGFAVQNYNVPTCGIKNNTAGNIIITSYVVPNGGSPGATNAYSNAFTLTTTGGGGTIPWLSNNPKICAPILTAGEAIVVNCDTASSSILGFVYVLEVPT